MTFEEYSVRIGDPFTRQGKAQPKPLIEARDQSAAKENESEGSHQQLD